MKYTVQLHKISKTKHYLFLDIGKSSHEPKTNIRKLQNSDLLDIGY